VVPGFAGRSPLLRLKSDEQLIALTRRGQQGAFEVLVQRYQSRLLAFCRHMLNSTEDAEDILQEVFTASYNAMIADERAINARPWLYRIARNRCLNHLRRPVPAGQDSMDVFERDGGTTTADTVHKREEFRQIVADVQELPETQRTALLLREIDALSYDDIAETMDTTVPSVKSLLVRARVSLAEAAEARLLTCDEVRLELGQVAEGIARTTAPVRRHLRACDRCRLFRGELRRANRALAAVYPLGPLVIAKKFFTAKVGMGAGASAGTTAGGGSGAGLAGAGAAAGGAGFAGGAGAGAGSMFGAGLATIASKAAAGLAAAAIVTAGAAEVDHVERSSHPQRQHAAAAVAVAQAPRMLASPLQAQPLSAAPAISAALAGPSAKPAHAKKVAKATPPAPKPAPAAAPAQQPTTPSQAGQQQASQPQDSSQSSPVQQDGSTVALDPGASDQSSSGQSVPAGPGAGPTTPAGESATAPLQSQPAPVVGEHHTRSVRHGSRRGSRHR
jgi:RNA polymerase sigma factor (sigma-70 family)